MIIFRAAEGNSAKTTKVLLKHGSKVIHCEKKEVKRCSDHSKVVSRNIIEARDKWGWTPLMRACRKGGLDVIRVLVKVWSLCSKPYPVYLVNYDQKYFFYSRPNTLGKIVETSKAEHCVTSIPILKGGSQQRLEESQGQDC